MDSPREVVIDGVRYVPAPVTTADQLEIVKQQLLALVWPDGAPPDADRKVFVYVSSYETHEVGYAPPTVEEFMRTLAKAVEERPGRPIAWAAPSRA